MVDIRFLYDKESFFIFLVCDVTSYVKIKTRRYDMKTTFTVGELAKEMEVTIRTLQYYDSIDLLKPSQHSEGGRRLYRNADKLRLHQILTLKSLGFSLEDIRSKILPIETKEDVKDLMYTQMQLLRHRISDYESAITIMEKMMQEIDHFDSVDFQKYADIISLIRNNDEAYWIVRCFDDDMMNHLRKEFADTPEKGNQIFETYQEVLEEAMNLQNKGIAHNSEEAIRLGKKWWDMVLDFTKGDLSLLVKLEEFNHHKEHWDPVLAEKQKKIDDYLQLILTAYFEEIGYMDEVMKANEEHD